VVFGLLMECVTIEKSSPANTGLSIAELSNDIIIASEVGSWKRRQTYQRRKKNCTQPVPPQIRIYYTMVRVSTCNVTKFKSSTLGHAPIK
jgi:hypothetical protein